MRRLLTLVVLSALAAPLAARADGSIQLGARAGVAKPFGDIGNGQKIGDFVDWAFPLEADLQFRLVPQFSIGAYARFSPTTLKSGCSGCSANDLGLGGVAEYRFSSRLEGGPWINVFGGWQQLKLDETIASAKQTATLTGFEGGAAGGVDFELGGLTLGPFLQLTIGEYTKQSITGGGSQSIPSKGAHAFFGGGIRLLLLL